MQYDLIIIGARCAGSPTAMLLARKGYRVLLVDKATFPSDTISTHIVWQPGMALLKRWGVSDRISQSNCPPITKLTFDVGAVALVGCPVPANGTREAYAPRRTVLDHILLEAAAQAGAEVRQGFAISEVVMDGNRVTGVRGADRSGRTITELGRLTIGADGLHSLVARTAGAPEYNLRPTLACWYYSYWSGLSLDGVVMYPRDRRAFGAIPTNDGLFCVPVAIAQRDLPAFRADVEGNFIRTLEIAPEFGERVRAGRREERFRGMADVPNLFRKPYGPGWALVGDAGYHKDPIMARGITDAFQDAERLADAIDRGFRGREPLEQALDEYEQQRNAAVMPAFEMNCQFAALEPPPPPMLQLFAALAQNQHETDRFLGTIAGTVSIPEFFAPENLERIVTTAKAGA